MITHVDCLTQPTDRLHSLVYSGGDLIDADVFSSLPQPPEASSISLVSQHQHRLRRMANQWVRAALPLPTPSISTTTEINTLPIPARQLRGNALSGWTLYEAFGGIGSGLEACLRNGIIIKRYIYSDTGDVAQAIIKHRLPLLSAEYSHQLPPSAWTEAFTTLPHDVNLVT